MSLAVARPPVHDDGAGVSLEVSQPGDPLERHADEQAGRVVRRLAGQAGGDAAFAPRSPTAFAPRWLVQRSSLVEVAAETAGLGRGAAMGADGAGGLLVDDETATLTGGQMRKTPFLTELRRVACEAADRELQKVGRTADGCPYLEQLLGRYATRPAAALERSIRRYAPEARGATRAMEYLGPVSARLGPGVAAWTTTGRLPENLPDEIGGGGLAGGLAGPFFAATDGSSGRAGVDAAALTGRLGAGRPLDGSARARMESAFAHPFGDVRIHTDDRAAALSRDLEARAFTLGRHVAFGAGEFRPGEPAGDALLAHELAHVVQQTGAPAAALQPQDQVVEADADEAATAAVATLHAPGRVPTRPAPRRGLGMRLSRCRSAQPRRVLRTEATPFGTYSIINDGVPEQQRQQNDLTEAELTRLRTVWTAITSSSGGLVIHGTATDTADFIALLARELPRSRVLRSIVIEIVEDSARPVTINAGRDNAHWGDEFATNTVDLRDLEWWDDVPPAGAPWAQTRGEALVHILVERRHRATSGSAVFGPAHAAPLAPGGAQERYRRDRGQTGRVVSQTRATTGPDMVEGRYTDSAGNVTIIRRDHSGPQPVPYEQEHRAAGLAAGTAGVMRQNDMVADVTSDRHVAQNLFVRFLGATSHVDSPVAAVGAGSPQRFAAPLRGIVPIGGPITVRLFRRNAHGPPTLLRTIAWPHPFTRTVVAATVHGVHYGFTLELVRR